MIYTCTLNPSLDYYMEFENPLQNKTANRSQLEYYEAGGKGINVSIVLNNLMIPSRAFGFLGGFTKDFYISLLEKYEYLQPNFTYIDGHTRVNVKLNSDGQSFDLNAAGPYIISKNMLQLKTKVERLDENDIFVFSGNSPDYLLDDVEEMISLCARNGVRLVLDTNSTIIKRCLRYKPYLISPNIDELREIAGTPCDSEEEIIQAVKTCINLGAQHVMVYRKEMETIMASQEGVYKARPIKQGESSLDTVGTQDAMVAGFVMSSLRTGNSLECFRYAACCKEATLFAKNLEIRDRINDLYDQIDLEEVK